MKQLYIFLLLVFLAINLHSQNVTTIETYQRSLDKKEDFWSKIKSVFKPKKGVKSVERTSEPVLVKNDPNRTVRRVYKSTNTNSVNDYNTKANEKQKMTVPVEEKAEVVKKKKSLAQFWNELVNGKGYVPQKDYNALRKRTNALAENSAQLPLVNRSKIEVARNTSTYNKFEENRNGLNRVKIAEKEIASDPSQINFVKSEPVHNARLQAENVSKSENKYRSTQIIPASNVKVKAVDNRNIINRQKPVEAIKPVVIDVKPNVAIASNIVPSNTQLNEENRKVISKIPAKELAKAPVVEFKPKDVNPILKNERVNKSNIIGEVRPAKVAEPKPKAVLVETKPKVVILETVDNTIRNEIQPLSLIHSASGTASYFFSGASFGKFYVVTNLATKGSVIKVVNTNNGKSLLAEVMDALPSSDLKKGLLLKISDNAKLPLGQNNKSFAVKVNY